MRINELNEAAVVNGADYVAVDSENGTKKVKVSSLLGGAFKSKTVSKSYEAVANSTLDAIALNVNDEVGYTPIGVIGYATSHPGVVVSKAMVENGTLSVSLRNVTSVTGTQNLYIAVLYAKSV